MKNVRFLKTGWLFAGLILALAVGCKKDDKAVDSNTDSAADNAFAENIYNEVSTMSDQARSGSLVYRLGSGEQSLLSQCATVTIDTASNPGTITIDFGTSNCMCSDGRNRRGKILIGYTGGYRDSGSVHTITFDDYYVNDFHVQGTKVVTNMGHNTSGKMWFSISVNGVITSPGGDNLTWSSTRQRVWTAGESTIWWWLDDVYEISGTASGTSFANIPFAAVITEPLVVALNCWWIKDGTLEFTPTGITTRVIDYGYQNGDCDNKAQVTIGSTSFIVIMQ